MKRAILLTAAMLFITTAPLHAEEEQRLGVTLDISYLTKWLSKGARAYGAKGALFKTVDVDLYGTGFGVKVTHRSATSSGYVDKQRFDYRPYYKNRLFEGESYVTNYNISGGYEHYPGLARDKANTTYEWIFAFSWPEILPGPLVPSYICHYEYPASGGDVNSDVTGWVHRFRLVYEPNLPEIQQPLYLSSELAYTDGLGGAGVDHDWSYATFGALTKLQITQNLTFVPGIYYQISMDDSVDKQNELYAILSMKYSF